MAKTWREKLNSPNELPKVAPLCGRTRERLGEGTMVIPSPMEVDAIMKQIPRGKLITINEMREILADRHGATMACPMATGIFAWLAANAAEEARAEGDTDTTAYWRTLKTGGVVNPKYPGGVDSLIRRLESEGHRVIQKGNRAVVADYRRALLDPRQLAS